MICVRRRRLLFTAILVINCMDSKAGDTDPVYETGIIEGPTVVPKAVEHVSENDMLHNISIVGDQFMLDGQPMRIVSGSLHYFRLPAEYWRDRLRKLKAAGLNSVCTYVEWSYHEPEERAYSFEGDRDVAQFVRLAAEEGLHVLLRPGPYICAERDLGGLPYWLLGKYPQIKLRSTNKDFIKEVEIWMAKLFEQISPLLFGNGGPIILVQVENEYGSYGNDMAYKVQIRDILAQHVGSRALLYTTDGSSRQLVENGRIPGTLTTVDFGAGNDVVNAFKPLRRYMPEGPLMNSEFYPGWLTHWGERVQRVSTASVVKTLKDMLDYSANVNFYMFFGGTNFEFSSGANYGDRYQPDITSYDYDAPLTEAGDPTPKYLAIRKLLEQYYPKVKDIPIPTPAPKGNYGNITVTKQLNLLSAEGRSRLGKQYADVTGPQLPTFEVLRQRAGLVLYETTLTDSDNVLAILKPRDRVNVYVDGELSGIISRNSKVNSLALKSKPGSRLSLLVENQGRINFGSHLHDYKGILGYVKYGERVLDKSWNVTGYPLEDVQADQAPNQKCPMHGPVLYSGQFVLPSGQKPLDTYLDPTGWTKGYVWVNGHNLGRYRPKTGPQVTLYVPGVWLRPAPAHNTLHILELEAMPDRTTVLLTDIRTDI